MRYENSSQNRECQSIQPLLSEYTDNALAARQVWVVEKHLAICPDCATLSREMQETVRLLRTSDRFDTADDFMAKLHARLDGLEPEVARPRSLSDGMRDVLAGLRETLRGVRTPALGMSLGAVALLGIMLLNRPLPTVPGTEETATVRTAAPRVLAPEPLRQNVALSASDPFEDPAAANLAAHSALNENTPSSETEGSNL